MGWGDEIMVSSIAKRIHAMTNQRVRVIGRDGLTRWSEIWDGLPCFAGRHESELNYINNGPSLRHYYSGMDGNRILWRKWDIAPGEIRLTDDERKWALEQFTMGDQHPRFIVINPTWKAKGGGGSNKDWGAYKWSVVAAQLMSMLLVQVGDGPTLTGAIHIDTPTFRHACAILERSIGYVGHEGGLHHAAAALGKPAVVVFGGYISPEVTGYHGHQNLYAPDERYPLGCGTVTPCEHCRESMSKITVEQVVEAVRKMVNEVA
jgi:hypothetical protein